jgi:hypothetical protein
MEQLLRDTDLRSAALDIRTRAHRQSSSLRPLLLSDEARFREAVEIERPSSWLYYFPFLYCFSQSKIRTLFWEEVNESICVYLRKSHKKGDRWSLYLPPFPFSFDALIAARKRTKELNGTKGNTIIWAEEMYHDRLELAGYDLRHDESEYIYDTAKSIAAAGGDFSRLRQHLNRLRKTNGLSFLPFQKEDRRSCLKLLDSWYDQLTEEKGVDVGGYPYVHACVENACKFLPGSLEGIVTRIDDRVVGVTFGGPIHSSMGSIFVCYSDHHLEGLGYLQRHEFMSRFSGLPLYNDSSDAGRTGLSHVKRQFRPVHMNSLSRATL